MNDTIRAIDARRGDEIALLWSDGPGAFHRVLDAFPSQDERWELRVYITVQDGDWNPVSYCLRPNTRIARRIS